MNVSRTMPPPSCSGWRTGIVVIISIGIVVKEIDHLGPLGDGGCRWFSIVLVLLLVVATAATTATGTGAATSPKLARPPTAVATTAATAAAAAVHRWLGLAWLRLRRSLEGFSRSRPQWPYFLTVSFFQHMMCSDHMTP